MEKTYIYRVYDGANYRGILPNVINDFEYTEAVNKPASELKVVIGKPFEDFDPNLVLEYLEDDNDDEVVDHNNLEIVTDVSSAFDPPIDLGNRVIVSEYSDDNPDGVRVFDGIIVSWTPKFKENVTELAILSQGVRMENYLIEVGGSNEVSQTEYDSEFELEAPISKADPVTIAGQTFMVVSDGYKSGVRIVLSTNEGEVGEVSYLLVVVREGTPDDPGELIGSTTVFYSLTATPTFYSFTFSEPVYMENTIEYHVEIQAIGIASADLATPKVHYNASGVYGDGEIYLYESSAWSTPGGDMAFEVIGTSAPAGASFEAADPGNIAKQAVDVLRAKGGLITYDDADIELVGTGVNYDYKIATISETIEKARQMAGGQYYWYTDKGSNKLSFKRGSGAADHKLTLGRHFQDLEITATIEQMKNNIHFSGGDTGSGNNLYIVKTGAASVSRYGQWLDRISDNRVTVQATAERIANSELNQFQTPLFRASFEIFDVNYDIATIKLGQLVKLQNVNDLIDINFLKIVMITRRPNSLYITLDEPEPMLTDATVESQRRVMLQETIDNPDTPS